MCLCLLWFPFSPGELLQTCGCQASGCQAEVKTPSHSSACQTAALQKPVAPQKGSYWIRHQSEEKNEKHKHFCSLHLLEAKSGLHQALSSSREKGAGEDGKEAPDITCYPTFASRAVTLLFFHVPSALTQDTSHTVIHSSWSKPTNSDQSSPKSCISSLWIGGSTKHFFPSSVSQ